MADGRIERRRQPHQQGDPEEGARIHALTVPGEGRASSGTAKRLDPGLRRGIRHRRPRQPPVTLMCLATAGAGASIRKSWPARLAGEEPVERLVDRRAAAGAQQVAKLDLLVVAEAAIDRAGRGDPDAVAAGRRNCR